MAYLYPILFLIASNTFMTIAWYGHLKHPDTALFWRILISWLIAFPEYALQVPANALGAKVMSATQLKIIQEVVSIFVFVIFAWYYFGEKPNWRTAAAFVLIAMAVVLIVTGREETPVAVEAARETMTNAAAASPEPGAAKNP